MGPCLHWLLLCLTCHFLFVFLDNSHLIHSIKFIYWAHYQHSAGCQTLFFLPSLKHRHSTSIMRSLQSWSYHFYSHTRGTGEFFVDCSTVAKSEYKVLEYGGKKRTAVALELRWSYWKQTEALKIADNRLNIRERWKSHSSLWIWFKFMSLSRADVRCFVNV